MKKYVYKNITDQEQILIGIGVVAPGATIELDNPIENPNFELITEKGKRMIGIDPVTPKPEN